MLKKIMANITIVSLLIGALACGQSNAGIFPDPAKICNDMWFDLEIYYSHLVPIAVDHYDSAGKLDRHYENFVETVSWVTLGKGSCKSFGSGENVQVGGRSKSHDGWDWYPRSGSLWGNIGGYLLCEDELPYEEYRAGTSNLVNFCSTSGASKIGYIENVAGNGSFHFTKDNAIGQGPIPGPTVSVNPVASDHYGNTITVTGTVSHVLNDTLAMVWNFDDGTVESASLQTNSNTKYARSHVYTKPGTYTATVSATDARNKTTTQSITIEATNLPPLATIDGPFKFNVGTIGTITGFATDPDLDAIVSYQWTICDQKTGGNCTVDTTTVANLVKTFPTPGLYTVSLVVNDGFLNSPASATTITINNYPTANVGGPYFESQNNRPMLFDGSGSTDDLTATGNLIYNWDFGDGTTSANGGMRPTHSYAKAGKYTISLNVTDEGSPNQGGLTSTNSTTTEVTIVAYDPDLNKGGDVCDASGAINNGSNPINGLTGNKYQREIDYIGAGPFPLLFERHYNSRLDRQVDRKFGFKWRHTFDRTVESQTGYSPAETWSYRANGTIVEFVQTASGWAPRSNTVAAKLQAVTGGGWTYTDEDDTVERYDANGRLTSITNRAGLVQTLSYVNGQLQSIADDFGHSLVVGYDASGRVGTLTDSAQQVYTYGYDANGDLKSVTLPKDPTNTAAGQAVRTYYYDETGFNASNFKHLLTGIQDENAKRYATYKYDAKGRGTYSAHAGEADKVTFDYDTNPAGTVITDAKGQARVFAYKVESDKIRVGSITGPECTVCGGVSADNTYDANGFPDLVTDFNGNITDYDYNARGLETQRIEAKGTTNERTTITTWHATFRLPTCVIEPRKTVKMTYDDVRGNLLSRFEVDTTDVTKFVNATDKTCDSIDARADLSTLNSRRWTYTYYPDSAGKIAGFLYTIDGPRTDVTDVTTYTWDANTGNLTRIDYPKGLFKRITDTDTHGRPKTVIDANNVTTTYQYDHRGLARFVSAGNVLYGYETNEMRYDGVGQLARVIRHDGATTIYEYDDAHRLTDVRDELGNHIHYTLDGLGNKTAEDVYDPTGTLKRTHSWVFNTANRLKEERGAATPAQLTSYTNYDGNGNLKDMTDPRNNATGFGYDALNRSETVTDAKLGATRTKYFADDRIKSVMDAGNVETTYEYDGLGNVTRIVSQDAGTTQFPSYDKAGNVLTKIDANNKTTTYAYDALNRLDLVTYHDNTTADYVYDEGGAAAFAMGRLTRIVDVSGSTVYAYDYLGRMASKEQIVNLVSMKTRYFYNGKGQLRDIYYPSGLHLEYHYTGAQLARVTVVGGSDVVTNLQFEPFGGVSAWTWGNGNAYSKTFDKDGQLSLYRLASGSRTVGYDDAGNVHTVTNPQNASDNQVLEYDVLNRLSSYTQGTRKVLYGYDNSAAGPGNRTSLTVNGSATSYSYIPNTNRLRRNGGTTDFVYDNAGNITNNARYVFDYDVRNRLVGVKDIGTSATRATYSINEQGQRVAKTVYRGNATRPGDANGDGSITTADFTATQAMVLGASQATGNADCHADMQINVQDLVCVRRLLANSAAGDTTYFAYNDRGELMGEYNAYGDVMKEYVWLGGMPVAVIAGGKVYNVYTDQVNAPREIADASNKVVWSWASDPFGETAANQDPDNDGVAFTMNLRFPGQYYDQESGLHYNWNRFYDPQTGRYVSSDPIGLAGGVNVYAYVEGNPGAQFDAEGLEAIAFLMKYRPWEPKLNCVGKANCDFSAPMREAMQCFNRCTKLDNAISCGKNGHTRGPHVSGNAADLDRKINPLLSRAEAERCADQCFSNGMSQEEYNSDKNVGPTHFHLQVVPGRGDPGLVGFRPGIRNHGK